VLSTALDNVNATFLGEPLFCMLRVVQLSLEHVKDI